MSLLAVAGYLPFLLVGEHVNAVSLVGYALLPPTVYVAINWRPQRRPVVQQLSSPVVEVAAEEDEDLAVSAAPSGSGYFVGRGAVVEQIKTSLASAAAAGRPGVFNLCGPPGIGKTTLAKQFARLMAAEYDGVLEASLRSVGTVPEDVDEVQAELLSQIAEIVDRSSGDELLPFPTDDRAGLYRRCVEAGSFLIVLDNVDNVAQIKELIPANPACSTIVISRFAIGEAPVTASLQVGSLETRDALALLARIVDARRVEDEPDAAQEIVRLCGNMPLALTIAGALLALRPYWSLQSFAQRLRGDGSRLDELRVGDVGVRESLSVSYDGLPELEQSAFRTLGLWEPETFAPWVLSPLLDVSIAQATQTAQSLERSSLLQKVSETPVRYAMHELVRCYAKEKLEEAEAAYPQLDAVRQLADAYLVLSAGVVRTADPARRLDLTIFGEFPSGAGLAIDGQIDEIIGPDPLHWLVAESQGLVAVFDLAKRNGLSQLCWQIALVVLPFFELMRSAWGRWEMPTVAGGGFEQDALRLDRRSQSQGAVIHQIRGAMLMGADRFEAAMLEYAAAIELFEKVGDKVGRAESMRGHGEVLRMFGRHTEACRQLEQALVISLEVDDRLGQARTLLDLGNCHRIMHQDQLAEAELQEALDLFVGARDEFGQARVHRALGNVQRQHRAYETSRRQLDHALRIFESFEVRPGDSYWAACTHYSIGKLLRDTEEFPAAADEFQQAFLAFGNGPGARLWKARIRRQLALVRLEQGRTDEAEDLAKQALERFEKLEVAFWVAHGKHTLGRILAAQPDGRAAARLLLQDAGRIYGELENSWYAADAAIDLALTYPSEHAQDAIQLLRTAFGTFGQFDDRPKQIKALRSLESLERLTVGTRPLRRRRVPKSPLVAVNRPLIDTDPNVAF